MGGVVSGLYVSEAVLAGVLVAGMGGDLPRMIRSFTETLTKSEQTNRNVAEPLRNEQGYAKHI